MLIAYADERIWSYLLIMSWVMHNHFTSWFVMAQTLILILCCLAHEVLLMLGTYYSWIAWHQLYFLLFLAPIKLFNASHMFFLNFSTHTCSWITRHLNNFPVTRHMKNSGSLNTWILLCIARHILYCDLLSTNWNYDSTYIVYSTFIWKWLSVLTLNYQYHLFDQKSPPLTWVSKTLN